MQVRPQDATVDMLNGLQQVMVVAPINADEDKAHGIAKKHRQQWAQRRQVSIVRWAQFEHHDRDDNRDHAVTECFHAIAGHVALWLLKVRLRETRLAQNTSQCSRSYFPMFGERQ